MTKIATLISSRRSVYPPQFNDEPISKDTIEKLLEAANWAPTHRRTEPWRFKVFHSDKAREELSQFLKEVYPKSVSNFSEIKLRKMVEKPLLSGCVIAICFQRDPNETLPEWEEIASTAMAVQNMWLSAAELKLGAYWSSPSLIQYFGDYFPMDTGERCLGFFYLGYYDGMLSEGTRKTPITSKVSWI